MRDDASIRSRDTLVKRSTVRRALSFAALDFVTHTSVVPVSMVVHLKWGASTLLSMSVRLVDTGLFDARMDGFIVRRPVLRDGLSVRIGGLGNAGRPSSSGGVLRRGLRRTPCSAR